MENNKNAHDGHRQRMWQKFTEHGVKIFNEHELLEILLFILIPRVNTNEISHELIRRFGSLRNVLETSVDDLQSVKGIGKNSAVQLRYLGELARYVNRNKLKTIKLDSSSTIIDFCIEYFKGKSNECLSFFLLDDKLTLMYNEDIDINKPNETEIDCSKLIRQTVKFECQSVILAHNHPVGSAYASNVDITTTRTLSSLLKAINVKIVDHVVIHGNTGYSMRKSGEAPELWY